MRRFSKASTRLFTVSFLALFALSTVPACRRKNKPPNVLIVLVDSLRADYLGCYGFDVPISPEIDRLAAESVRFDNAVTPAVWSQPAVASLFTGLPPDALGGPSATPDGEAAGVPMETAFSSSVLTMAEAFRSSGYHTAAFVSNPWISADWGFARGFDAFERIEGSWDHPDANVVSSHALGWLAHQTSAPFFVFVHYMDVHGPYAESVLTPSIVGSSSLGLDRDLTADELARRPPYFWKALSANRRDERERLAEWKGMYAWGVWLFDQRFGGFLRALRRGGYLRDTIVVVLSDHGEELLDHGSWEHATSLYRETVRVPLLIRLPNGRGAGRVVPDLVGLADVFPTLARWAGLDDDVPGLFDRDFGGLLTATRSGGDQTVVSVADGPGRFRSRTLQDGRYQLLVPGEPGRHPELFDVVADPWEKSDLAGTRRDVVDRLSAALKTKVDAWKSGRLPRAKVVMTRDEAETLEALVPLQ